MAKILVTGAAGFIGFHLCRFLLAQGHKVCVLDALFLPHQKIKKARLKALKKQAKDQSFVFVQFSLNDADKLHQLFKQQQFNYVVHLAAQTGVRRSVTEPQLYVESNVVAFINLLEACKKYPVQHLVYASSSSVYGQTEALVFKEDAPANQPLSIYAASKKAAEMMAYSYAHLHQIKSTGLRFFTVYGPWTRPDMAAYLFAEAILNNQPIKVFNHGQQQRDFTYVADVVQVIEQVLFRGQPSTNVPHQILNVGNQNAVPLLDFISCIEKHCGKKAQLQMMPAQAGDVQHTQANTNKLQQLINFKPSTPLDTGIAAFVDWFKQYHSIT